MIVPMMLFPIFLKIWHMIAHGRPCGCQQNDKKAGLLKPGDQLDVDQPGGKIVWDGEQLVFNVPDP